MVGKISPRSSEFLKVFIEDVQRTMSYHFNFMWITRVSSALIFAHQVLHMLGILVGKVVDKKALRALSSIPNGATECFNTISTVRMEYRKYLYHCRLYILVLQTCTEPFMLETALIANSHY